jgi:hypothetical protein
MTDSSITATNDSVDISGLNKSRLLFALWNNSGVASVFKNAPFMAPSLNMAKADEAVLGYIDYFCGRCIKSDLSGDSVNPYLYDRDMGPGAFAKVVAQMRR